jgi:hypothetical protein
VTDTTSPVSPPGGFTRWLRALTVGVLAALVIGVVATIVAALVLDARGMSDFEGERSMFAAMVLGPAGALLGLVAGVAFGQRPGSGARHVFRQLGLATATMGGVIAAVAIWGLVTADHPPKLDGRKLALEFEVKIPSTSALPPDLSSASFTANLHTTDSDNRFATLEFDKVRTEDGARLLSGAADLYTRTVTRRLLVGTWPSQVFDIALPASPAQAQFEWSTWIAPTALADLSPVPAAEKFALRYRVQFAK